MRARIHNVFVQELEVTEVDSMSRKARMFAHCACVERHALRVVDAASGSSKQRARCDRGSR
jgi:hypothetical protein